MSAGLVGCLGHDRFEQLGFASAPAAGSVIPHVVRIQEKLVAGDQVNVARVLT